MQMENLKAINAPASLMQQLLLSFVAAVVAVASAFGWLVSAPLAHRVGCIHSVTNPAQVETAARDLQSALGVPRRNCRRS